MVEISFWWRALDEHLEVASCLDDAGLSLGVHVGERKLFIDIKSFLHFVDEVVKCLNASFHCLCAVSDLDLIPIIVVSMILLLLRNHVRNFSKTATRNTILKIKSVTGIIVGFSRLFIKKASLRFVQPFFAVRGRILVRGEVGSLDFSRSGLSTDA